MNRRIIILLTLIAVIGSLILYFIIPLSAKKVLPALDNIDRIYLVHARWDDGLHRYENTPIEDTKELKEFTTILNSVKYSNVLKSKDILNYYQFERIIVICRNPNGGYIPYSLDINENGYISVTDKKTKKYKIIRGEGANTFHKIREFINHTGIKSEKQ